MDMYKACWREGEVTTWNNGIAGNFGSLGYLAISGPIAAVLLNGWAHEELGDRLSRCLNPWVAEGMQGVENPTAEREWHVWARFTIRSVTVQLE